MLFWHSMCKQGYICNVKWKFLQWWGIDCRRFCDLLLLYFMNTGMPYIELIILGFSWFKQVSVLNFFFIRWKWHSSEQLSKYLLYSIDSGGKIFINFSEPAFLGKGAVFWLSWLFNWNSEFALLWGFKDPQQTPEKYLLNDCENLF